MIRHLLLFVITLSTATLLPAQSVPATLTYCGMTLNLTPGAQRKLQGYVDRIHESPRYYNAIVEIADTYMPFIEEAFRDAGVPEDLKYLAIQESSLRADAVSSSNAVGFWQFKREPAVEYGLRVDELVDERRHIFRASQAAAHYLLKANYDFDNWVYAVIAYYEGLTGAIPYTEPDYYSKREMEISERLHWYVLKAIAHKLAYEEALSMDRPPIVWLEPHSTQGAPRVADLCERLGVLRSTFLEYNKWILNDSRLPKTEFTCYLPHYEVAYPGHKTDPIKATPPPQTILAETEEAPLAPLTEPVVTDTPQVLTNPQPDPVAIPEPRFPTSGRSILAINPDQLPDLEYARFPLYDDLDYGLEYLVYDGQENLNDVANRFDLELAELLNWNNLSPSRRPPDGTILYLKRPRKAAYHIVQEGESLISIAQQHEKSLKKLRKVNRMDKEAITIYIGQKLYLRKKKPRDEKMILLVRRIADPEENPYTAPTTPAPLPPRTSTVPPRPQPASANTGNTTAVQTPASSPSSTEPKTEAPEADPTPTAVSSTGLPPAQFETQWVEHTVAPGETLWNISVRYGTKVAIIKLTNRLSSDDLSPGQKLRILAKTDKLHELDAKRR